MMTASLKRRALSCGNLATVLASTWIFASPIMAADPADTMQTGGPTSGEAEAESDQPKAPTTDGGQEIIVTATRRSESETKVPQSILAFDQATLDAKSIRSIDDLSSLSPGLDIDRSADGNGSLTNISIRGIVSNSETATTGVYIDDAPVQVRKSGLSLFGTALPALFDLDHVEVLRGPQGTLFGAGSMGGALRFITPAPSLSAYSGYGRWRAIRRDWPGSWGAHRR